jgi:hypothetical protein
MVVGLSVYDSVRDIAEDYFGPAAPRYVRRIIINHLDKTPEKLRPKDIPQLVSWVKVTLSFLTDDTELVEEFVSRIMNLADQR